MNPHLLTIVASEVPRAIFSTNPRPGQSGLESAAVTSYQRGKEPISLVAAKVSFFRFGTIKSPGGLGSLEFRFISDLG